MGFPINIIGTLMEYDIPHLFLAKDKIGGLYLCLLVEDGTQLEYLTVDISQKRLRKLLSGDDSLDLRDVYLTPEIARWYWAVLGEDKILQVETKALEGNTVPERWLPEKECFLPKMDVDKFIVSSEAQTKEKTIVHLSLSERWHPYGVAVEILGDFIKIFQKFLSHVYTKIWADIPADDKQNNPIKNELQLRAFAASEGSFNIHMEIAAKAQTDLFGGTAFERALEKINDVTTDFDSSEMYIELLKTIKGHSISSYKKLVEKITAENVTIKYSWYSFKKKSVFQRELNTVFADRVLKIINQKNDLSQEIREFKGTVSLIDIKTGNWRVLNEEDKKEYKGFADSKLLEGLIAGNQNYRLICEEVIKISPVTDKEETTYKILSMDKI
jgi:hypothetical protein